MTLIKRIITVLLAIAIALSLVACGDTSWIVKVDGETVNSGLYIYYQSQGYSAAGYELMAQDPNYNYYMQLGLSYIDDPIGEEGETVRDYMNEYAMNMCKQYVVVGRLFDQLGLELTEDELSLVDTQVRNLWNNSEDALVKAGISQDTVEKAIIASLKEEKVFNAYYEVGGLNGTTEEDIQGYLEDNYARIKYITFNFADDATEAVDTDRKNEALETAQSYLDRALTGESMDDLIAEYAEILEQAEVEESAEEDETVKENLSEIQESENAEEAESADESADGAESTDGTDGTDETEGSSDVDDITSQYPNEVIINNEGTAPSEKFISYVFNNIDTGEFDLVQDDLNVYLVQKLDILERDDIYDDNRETFLYALFDSDYTALINDTLADYTVEVNERSVKRYKPDRAIGLE